MNMPSQGLRARLLRVVARPKLWAVAPATAFYVTVFASCPLADHAQRADPWSQSQSYAPEPGTLSLVYDVEAMGIPAMTARFDINYRANHYDMSFALHTTGLLDWMLNWNMSMSAQGVLKDMVVVPERYHEVRRARALEIVYVGGKIVSAPKTPPSRSDQRPEIAEAGRLDALDLLSLTLAAMLTINAGPSCSYRGMLYDGSRLFDLVVTPDDASGSISPPIPGLGPSLVCDFVWYRRAPQYLQKDPNTVIYEHSPQIYRLWFSRVSAKGPMVPVKLIFDLDVGVAEATLSKSGIEFLRPTEP